MADRSESPAYAALPRSARWVFAAIEAAIGDGSKASVSYVAFRLDHHIARPAVSRLPKLLDHLGMVEISPGPRLVNVFRLPNGWWFPPTVAAQPITSWASGFAANLMTSTRRRLQ
jgi:hypothetical protein